MVEFDRDERPTLDDLKNNWKVKLTIAAVLIIAICAMIFMDVTGQVGSWR